MSTAIAVIVVGAAVIIVSAAFNASRRSRNVDRHRRHRNDSDPTYVPVFADTSSPGSWNTYVSDTQDAANRASAGDGDGNGCVIEDDKSGFESGSDSCSSDFGGSDFGGGDSGGGGGDSGGGGSD
jgi:uncharacterized membrane protein YgcG